MAKELRTAEQLSDKIVSSLDRKGDRNPGPPRSCLWVAATVVASPGDLIGYQRRVEEIERDPKVIGF